MLKHSNIESNGDNLTRIRELYLTRKILDSGIKHLLYQTCFEKFSYILARNFLLPVDHFVWIETILILII